ncbi:hypothetical protein PanWU01x14_207600 [Parasponia andersonii]|uniref:Uncharacterized protein n=1 Tax=Parasponia andersonii TaxID=3476 RepID=A0A2P5BV38_PARAD|nr:hypothetical protein PanWU01x14_207600 [Parasponia andersonii]
MNGAVMIRSLRTGRAGPLVLARRTGPLDMDMNRIILIDLDDNEYRMDDHDSETEEMQNQPRAHTRVGAPTSGSGTRSTTQDSNSGSAISKRAKACTSKV